MFYMKWVCQILSIIYFKRFEWAARKGIIPSFGDNTTASTSGINKRRKSAADSSALVSSNFDFKAVKKMLDDDVIGNDEAKTSVMKALVELKTTGKATPLCFIGPEGAGKHFFAQAVARSISRELIEVDCSVLMEVSDLIGDEENVGLIAKELKVRGMI